MSSGWRCTCLESRIVKRMIGIPTLPPIICSTNRVIESGDIIKKANERMNVCSQAEINYRA